MPSRTAGLALLLASVLGLALGLAKRVTAEAFMSREEALALAFPGADRVDRRSVALDDAQARAVESRARSKLESRLVTLYTGVKDGAVLGHAFIDVHQVRTLPEGLLIVLSPEGEVRGLRMLAFYEPQEYLPTDRWLRQFEARRLDDELQLQRGLHGIAGATFSARAVTAGVRRALALYELLLRESPEPAAPAARPPAAGHQP